MNQFKPIEQAKIIFASVFTIMLVLILSLASQHTEANTAYVSVGGFAGVSGASAAASGGVSNPDAEETFTGHGDCMAIAHVGGYTGTVGGYTDGPIVVTVNRKGIPGVYQWWEVNVEQDVSIDAYVVWCSSSRFYTSGWLGDDSDSAYGEYPQP